MRLPLPWGRLSGHRLNLKILAVATCISLFLGFFNMLGPIEVVTGIARAKLRSHPPSGQLVVVTIDDQSLSAFGPSPWPRALYGQLISKLHAAGAQRIGIDALAWGEGTPAGDAAFERAVADAKGSVVLPVRVTQDPMTDKSSVELPPARLRRLADVGSTNVMITWNGMVTRSPYSFRADGMSIPSMPSAVLQHAGKEADFPIDFSVDLHALPVISAADILHDRWNAARIAGKDVLIGETANALRYGAPGYGAQPVVYIHAAAIESLLEGTPHDIGWLPPLATAALCAGLYLFARRRVPSRAALATGFAAVLAGPFVGESLHAEMQCMPALLLLAIVSLTRFWFNIRQTMHDKGLVNAVSGQPNLNALREASPRLTPIVVVARILNYAEVTTSLPAECERDLVEQIVNRLSVGAHGDTVYQADDGLFIWLADTANDEAVGENLMALHGLFRSPVVVAGRLIDLAVTFGLDTDTSRPVQQRVSSAVVAADRAASEGRRWMTYDPAELEDAEWKMSLLARLDQAVERDEIWVAYQPKIDMASGRIIGAEALARWAHPEKGEVPPSQFIPAAERSGRIENLTAHILDSAVAATAGIHRTGRTDFSIAVNLSARLLDSPGLLAMVADTLARHRLDPHHLILEITETTAMASQDGIVETLEALSASGVRLSIDDYGTGFSTLDYLKRIPADEIKIDRSFVSMLEKSQSDRIMVHSTIQLAHSLGRKTVAEGVENAVVLNELRLMQCDYVQGYFTGKPMKLSALIEEFAKRESLVPA